MEQKGLFQKQWDDYKYYYLCDYFPTYTQHFADTRVPREMASNC